MDVQIEQLTSSVDVADGGSLLSPDVLRRIVAAVKAELEREAANEQVRTQDLDTRSIVDQQRGGAQ